MSAIAVFPLARWLEGTTQPDIPFNDNALRNEVLAKGALSIANSEPGSPSDGDVHIVGTAWGGFSTDDVVIYKSGTWYGFMPFAGWIKAVGSDIYFYDSSWTLYSGGGGGGGPSTFGTASIATGVLDLTDETVGVWIVSLTENVTSVLLPTAVGDEALSIIVLFVQDGTGGRTVSGWPTTTWEAGSAPTMASAAGALTSVPLLILGNGSNYGVS